MAIAFKEGSPELFTVPEVAKLLRLSTGAVRKLIEKKEIPALRFGKQYRIPRYVIENLFAPLLGEGAEQLGFGLWKRRKDTEESVRYVQKIRKREERKSLEQILEELREWEKTSSSTRMS